MGALAGALVLLLGACGPGEPLPESGMVAAASWTTAIAQRTCDATSCPDGCCSGNVCTRGGAEQIACGAHGRACVSCVGNRGGTACVLTADGDRVCACGGPLSGAVSPDCAGSIDGFACVYSIDSASGRGCGCLSELNCPPLRGVPRSCDLQGNVCLVHSCLFGASDTPCNGGCCTPDHLCVIGTADEACGNGGYCTACGGASPSCLDQACT